MLSENLIHKIDRLRARALLAGGAGVAATLAGGALWALTDDDAGIEKVFQPFLVAYIITVGLSVGCLAGVMLHHLCGGAWSFMIQRILEAASRTLPYVLGLGVLVVLGGAWFGNLYPWTSEEFRQTHHIVEKKEAFLNLGTFTIAFFIYYAIWMSLMFLYNGWSKRVDETGDPATIARMRQLAAPGLMVYVLSLTFAAVHWVMSLEPEWFSTIFGAWLIAGYNITIVAFATIVLSYLAGEAPISGKITTRHFHHLGTFMCGFVIFWSYVSFCQFLLIWNANIPEEIAWYLNRQGSLTFLTIILMIFNWFVPMMLLLMRNNKTNPVKLRRIAFYLLAVRLIDVYWNIVPSFPGNHRQLNWFTVVLVVAAAVGVIGLWVWLFLGELKKRPLLAVQDPRHHLFFLKDEAHSHA
ncbi:MAG: hypothetical protein HYV26_18875 [Candidatus Hydrogenedentes bacterium]|nr:hypothetical protein [Candidatus Hydrogenedentota bacterium]